MRPRSVTGVTLCDDSYLPAEHMDIAEKAARCLQTEKARKQENLARTLRTGQGAVLLHGVEISGSTEP